MAMGAWALSRHRRSNTYARGPMIFVRGTYWAMRAAWLSDDTSTGRGKDKGSRGSGKRWHLDFGVSN